MFTAADILIGFVLPAVVCAAISGVAWRAWRRGEGAGDARWANAIALGAGYGIGYGRLVGDLGFPPGSPDNWILYAMPVVMAVGVLLCVAGRAPLVRVLWVAAVCASLNFMLVRPLLGAPMGRGAAGLWVAGGTVVMTLWWVSLNEIARRGPRVLAPVVGAIVAAGAAAILGDGGLAVRGGFPLGVVTVELGVMCVVAALGPRFSLAGGGVLAVTLIVVGTTFYGYHYIYPEPGPRMMTALAMVLEAPLAGLVVLLPRAPKGREGLKTVIAIVVVLMVVAGAVMVAGVGRHPVDEPGEVAVSE